MSRVNKIMVIQCKKRETVKFKLIKFYSIHETVGIDIGECFEQRVW